MSEDERTNRISHDQLFKQVIEAFFADFLRLFAPDTAAGLDLSTITFRNAEVFTDIPQGERRTADIVAEVQTLDGVPKLIIVHVEIQREPDVDARLRRYYMALRQREGKPVIPIALVFYRGHDGIAWEEYQETLFGHTILTFRYLQISLPLLNAEDYVQVESVLGAGLASVMRAPSDRPGQIALRHACLRRVLDAEQAGAVDPARAFLLGNLVETYLPISVEEREALRLQLTREGNTTMDVDVAELTWAGRIDLDVSLRTKRDAVRRVVQRRFGLVAPDVEAVIAATDTEDGLDALLDQAVVARTQDELV